MKFSSSHDATDHDRTTQPTAAPQLGRDELARYARQIRLPGIGIADGDRVEPSNLHRQLLHRTTDIGSAKTDSARATRAEINPYVRIDAIGHRVSRENALDLVTAYDVVIDCTDDFPTRYLLNDACAPDADVLGVLPGLIGILQATETLKLIVGFGASLVGRLLLVDTLFMRFPTIALERDLKCPACGTPCCSTS